MIQLLEPRWLLPIEPWSVVEDGAVALEDRRIIALGNRRELREKYPDAHRTVLPDHVLLPGLVNAHTHAAMTLLRGFADDVPLMTWLRQRIWPVEGRWVDPDFVTDGTRLAAAEMLRGGVTCFVDMYFFPAQAIEACLRSGMRILSGQVVVDATTAYANGSADHLQKAARVIEQYRDAPGVHFSLAPHAPYTVSDEVFVSLKVLSEELGIPLHTHLHETVDEVEESITQYGVRPLERLDRLGVVDPHFMAVHAVHLTDDEISLLADRGASAVHCPTSNLKLASGVARFADWLAAGMRVGLGTDGVASNNRLDLLSDMRLASLLAKGSTGDASVVPAQQALWAATLGGANALGLGHLIGSIGVDKSADLIAVDLSDQDLSPMYDVASHLVNCVDRHHVSDVWVAGRQVVRHSELVDEDPAQLRALATTWQERIRSS